MQYCPKCKVHIRGEKRCCPLCEGSLSGRPEDAAFPSLKKRKFSIATLSKIGLFIFVIVEVVMMAIQLISGFRFHVPGLIMMWAPLVLLDLGLAIYYRSNIIKLISYQAYIVMLVCLYFDAGDGRIGWSIHWVIPITLVCLTAVTIIIGTAVGLRMVDYMIYLAFDFLLALIQLVPVIRGRNTVPYAAVICIGLMVILAAFVAIFKPKELQNAFSKYMNV